MKRHRIILFVLSMVVIDCTSSFEKGKSECKTIEEVINTYQLDLSNDLLVYVSANSKKGFNYPYYLFVPKLVSRTRGINILVESNNTGMSSDDFETHAQRAKELTLNSHANQIARKLSLPLLLPIFPRPESEGHIYTQALDEDTLLIKEGPLKRIDLQLVSMIQHSQELLKRSGLKVKSKVFLHGFSASGAFANRFAILHPRIVQAIAIGGISAIPTLPMSTWRKTRLEYPVGIADLKEICGIDFDEKAYKKVWQYIYMGYLDRNDTVPFRDAYDEEDAMLIRRLIGEEIPDRWQVIVAIFSELQVPAQFVTYNGTAHWIREEMVNDIAEFFVANSGDSFVTIKPHEYPFVEYRETKEAHINALFWKGDEKVPEWARGRGEMNSFIICIEEWIDGQEYQQLEQFRKKAGFSFVLRAQGYEDISITEENMDGTVSSNDGTFQGFVVTLHPSQLAQMNPRRAYTIVPNNKSREYFWTVRDEVSLTKQ